MEPIKYYNRHTRRLETERVYGEGFLRWAYGNPLGKAALHLLVKRRAFSAWYGSRMNTPASAKRIGPFIEQYGLDPGEFDDPPDSFANFNEFFFRRLKPEARPVCDDPASAVFPADGRHLGFQRASDIDSVFVKGQRFDLTKLLGSTEMAALYADGPLVLSRLCPVDYHRFHFPVAGVPTEPKTIPGPLFSVSPVALRAKLEYLWTNKRTITLLDAGLFGTVAIIEIGATCVGSIRQTYTPGIPVHKSDEKGFFEFGGSSTITLFEPGRVHLAQDLLEQSDRHTELYARVGSLMGRAI
ncbi:MAG: phosphatidylserine decarboxylase [Luteolibacter sp.]